MKIEFGLGAEKSPAQFSEDIFLHAGRGIVQAFFVANLIDVFDKVFRKIFRCGERVRLWVRFGAIGGGGVKFIAFNRLDFSDGLAK